MNTLSLYTYRIWRDGSRERLHSFSLESKESLLPHHIVGRSFTKTGYGSRIPTTQMVKFHGRWRRVYLRIYSNIGTTFIGKWSDNLIVSSYD